MPAQSVSTKVYFEDIEFEIKKLLNSAEKSVIVCVAWISWKIFSPIFSRLAENGVVVEVMYNDDFINKRFFIEPIGAIEFPIKARSFSLMHNKFCIIDGKTLITGSSNLSKKASQHFENIIISKNDFPLIKSFLHELQDPKDYYGGYFEQQRQPCQKSIENLTCNSDSYNLAIIGAPQGKYSESHVTIWRICHRNNHARRLDDIYIPHLHEHFGFDNDIGHDEDDGSIYDVDDMYRRYKNERYFINELSEFLDGQNYKYKIHAVGIMAELNSNKHLEWDEPLEHSIKVIWRETYHRKVIPSELFEDDDTDEIFSWHIA